MSIGHGGQVLVSRTAAELARDVVTMDLGDHRLRDLSSPERVLQVLDADLPSAFPPLRSLDALPTNLTVQLTSFIGRETELTQMADLLRHNRLVTLTGVGGVGKTRLAVQLAAELLPRYPDGAWLCELASAEDEQSLAEVVAAAVRAPRRPGMSLLESVVEFLRPKRMLLVVDNCEHLLEPAGRLVEAVLQTCAQMNVLATSREGLGVNGEQLWPLRSLPTPRPADGPEAVGQVESVRLFIDRAEAVDPAFRISPDNAAAVGEICRRLDGIPLAIELAAARVVALSPVEIASLLDERFRLLTGGRRRAVERHQTLRATVEWSYSLLDDREREVFDRIGVFTGSFDGAAAAAVTSREGLATFDILDALESLVAKSMLGVEHPPTGTRFQLLETLRQYALERLEETENTDNVRRRQADHYARWAEKAGPLLLGPHELDWRPRLKLEVDNLRSAVGWALERPDAEDQQLALRILLSLAREVVLDRASGMGEWADRALAVHSDEEAGPDRDRYLSMAVMAGYGAFHRGDLDRSEALARQAVAAGRDSEPFVASWGLMLLANVIASRGDLNGAVATLNELASWLPEAAPYDQYTLFSVLALYVRGQSLVLACGHEKSPLLGAVVMF